MAQGSGPQRGMRFSERRELRARDVHLEPIGREAGVLGVDMGGVFQGGSGIRHLRVLPAPPPATENMTTACDSRRGQPSPSPSPGREDALATLTKAGASAARNDSSQLGEDTGGVRVRAAGEAAGEAARAGGPQRHGASRALRGDQQGPRGPAGTWG